LGRLKNPIFSKNRIFGVPMPRSGVKNPIFSKNRIFGVPMPLSGVKNPIFSKNRIFGVPMPRSRVKNPIFSKNRIFGAQIYLVVIDILGLMPKFLGGIKMLTQIKLTNFKCFKKETAFPLSQLNLLTGTNGQGKSTLLQSLLLMRQSVEHKDRTTHILLNGSCVHLGSFDEIINHHISNNKVILFEYFVSSAEGKGSIQYQLEENINDNMIAEIKTILSFPNEYHLIKKSNIFYVDKNNKLGEQPVYLLNLIPACDKLFSSVSQFISDNDFNIFSRIHYLSADRFGPQDFYLKSALTTFPNVGVKGEFIANVLYKKKDDLVNDKLCLRENTKRLITQTEAWLNQIFEGVKIEIPPSETNRLEILFKTGISTDGFKPANVGFGYSYILPIIVSGLIAKEGEILIVENPEAHLHPKAQSRLAKFLVKVSRCGVQVFIESHSDHILNALRIAVLDKIITTEELKILYFQPGDKQPVVVPIPVQPEGGIEQWPEDFFDQTDKDFERLFGV
jgi:predicted ATPase